MEIIKSHDPPRVGLCSTITSRLSTQLERAQFVCTQLVGVYFRVQGFPNHYRLCFAIACVLLQPVGAYFRVQGFPNRLCFAVMSKKPNEKRLSLGNGVIFQGFDSLYEHVFESEDQLLCPKVQAEAEETFDDLKKSFESFQSKIRTVSLKAKRKKLHNVHQTMIHDMFN